MRARYRVGTCLALLALTTIDVAPQVTSGPRHPNILLIVADDVGAEASSIYPKLAGTHGQVSTPNIERLAASGIVFDRAWANPMCSPTRATIITGLYGHRTGVTTAGDTLPTSTTSIFEFITAQSRARYDMGVFGKWHLSGNAAGGANAGHVHDTGVPVFKGSLGAQLGSFFNWTAFDEDGRSTPITTYSTTAITDFALQFITRHHETRPADPWFVDVSYNAAHSPFQVPPSDLHSVDVGGLKPGTVSNTLPVYKAMIQAMDSEIGRLLKAVDLNETLVIYIGDNGTPVIVKDGMAGVRGSKQSVYEGGVRVPLVIAGAGVTRKNVREDALVVSTDLFDTIAALADIPTAAVNAQDNNSFSLVPLFTRGGASTGRDYSFSELCGPQARRFAVRDTRYKLLFDNGEWGLYDLQSDPMESRNLYGRATVASEQASLAARIASLKAAAKFGCFQ